ncbi:hypothetical protein HELRODRAFT_173211 [Helobdella robusta]|uniref:Uncharacterized protein n=1 Tax=Helobdella robusta TaxID=6412 RepID=T1F6K8_HELRO|nr:hypothetical protein HELRODRAFT_173211 [Helobdella robusta]ESO04123.1 hypothetical protein HELRODRAFT_173211 [Helobdella robusta]
MYKAGYHKYLTSSCFHANFPLVDIDWADMEKDLKSVTSGILQTAEHEIRAPAHANVADHASKTSTREQLSKILDDLLTCFKGLVDVVRELSSILDYSATL